jgi:atypical dual specificity phosphatase
MKYNKQCLQDAFLYVRERRRCIAPNNGFWRQLIAYEYTLYGENSVHMLKRRFQRDIPVIYLSERNGAKKHQQLEQTTVAG